MTKRTQRYQLVIAGAGPVGLLFAAQLIRRPAAKQLRIRIVDAQPAVNWRADTMDPRVYALSRESQLLLGDRWASIGERRSSPYRRMRVWEGESPWENASIAFDAADVGEPDLGRAVATGGVDSECAGGGSSPAAAFRPFSNSPESRQQVRRAERAPVVVGHRAAVG